jgi:hypothetical protein
MKRRRFIQAMAAAPAIALPIVPATSAQQPAPPGSAPPRPADDAPKLEYNALDSAGEIQPHFFKAAQFAALQKLSNVLMPPMKDVPGALDAQVPQFLDFLISESPAERQQLYRAGLDSLNAQATKRFNKSFAELDAAQAGELLAPLRQPWTYEPPSDPFARFLRTAHQDIRTATMNSQEYNAANAAAGRRASGVGQYWYKIE